MQRAEELSCVTPLRANPVRRPDDTSELRAPHLAAWATFGRTGPRPRVGCLAWSGLRRGPARISGGDLRSAGLVPGCVQGVSGAVSEREPAGEGEGSGRVVRGDGLAPRSRSEGAADGVGAAGGGDPAFIPGVEAGVQGQRPGQEGRRRHASVAAQPPLFLPRSGGAVQGPRNLHSKVRYSRCIRYSVAIPPGSDDDEARARPSRPVPSPIQRGSP